jgi:hypothetical protein
MIYRMWCPVPRNKHRTLIDKHDIPIELRFDTFFTLRNWPARNSGDLRGKRWKK